MRGEIFNFYDHQLAFTQMYNIPFFRQGKKCK